MLLEKYKRKEIILEDTNYITENFIKLTTSLNNVAGSPNEYYDFIDNTISYFIGRKALLREQVQSDIGKFSTLKRAIKKNMNSDININVRVPNKFYYTIPDITFIYTDDKLKWNTKDNGKNFQYANMYSAMYNGLVKKMTAKKISKVSDISKKLLDEVTDEYNITDSKALIKFIDEFQFPMDDIEKIYKIIDIFIQCLKKLSKSSLYEVVPEDTDETMIVPLAIRMIDMKTLYVKSLINILLLFYTEKLSMINIVSKVEKSISEDTINNMMYNRQYDTESICILEHGIDFNKINQISEAYNYINASLVIDLKELIDRYYNKATNKLKSINNDELSNRLSTLYMTLNSNIENYKNYHTNDINVSTFYDKPFKYMSMELMGSIDEILNILYKRYDIFIDTSRIIEDKYYYETLDNINKNYPNYKEIISYVNKVRDTAIQYSNLASMEEPKTTFYNTENLDVYGNKKTNRYIDNILYNQINEFRQLCMEILEV